MQQRNRGSSRTFARQWYLCAFCALFFCANLAFGGWALGVKADRTSPGKLVRISSDGKEVLLDGGSCYGAAFSPDVKEVVYVRGLDIYIVGVDGTNARKVKSGGMINSGNEAQTLSWCDNGYIYYSKGWELYRVNTSGTGIAEKVHTSQFSGKGDFIRQLQVCRDGTRACSWGRPNLANGSGDGHVMIYKIGSPSSDKRWDNHCMGAISKSGKYFNATHASHEKTAIIEFDNAPASISNNGSSPDNLGVTPYRVLNKRSSQFDFHRFSQCDEDYIVWIEDTKGYVVKVSTGTTVMGPLSGFAPQDYYPGEFSSSSEPSVYLESPGDGSSWLPGASVALKARVTVGSADISSVVFAVDGSTIATKTSSPWEATWTASGNGTHRISVEVTDKAQKKATHQTSIIVASMYAYPDSVPHPVPGRIECEHFDMGGESIAYHDDSPGNSKSAFRSGENVDVETGVTSKIVTSTKAGEWLKYTVSIATKGPFMIAVSVANSTSVGAFHIELDGNDLTGPMTGSTDSYTTWKELIRENVVLPTGKHVLSLVFDQTGHIVDYIDIKQSSNPITQTAPVGGETFNVGKDLIVEWSCETSVVNDVHVEFSTDGARSWEDLSAKKLSGSVNVQHAEWGRFTYLITSDMVSETAMVRVREYGGSRASVSQAFKVAAEMAIDRKLPFETGKLSGPTVRRVNGGFIAEGATEMHVYSFDGKLLARTQNRNGSYLRIDDMAAACIVQLTGDNGTKIDRIFLLP